MDSDPDKWFQDRINPNLIQVHRINEVLYRGQSKFQTIGIIRTGSFGKCLVLDGRIQSSELDEFVYHEALVQPAMLAHPQPERVFIAGGGEGATLREILRHRSVTRAVMVDIDGEVVSLCRQYLPEWSQGAFEDRRTELYHSDARAFLAESRDLFDIIFIDLPEPIEEGPAYLLYTTEFYKIAQNRLTEKGIICVQSGSASYKELINFQSVYNTLKSVFPIVRPYCTDVPSFGNLWGFCLASMTVDPLKLSPAEVDKRISARKLDLGFYDGVTHQGIFAMPRHLRDSVTAPARIITDDQPLYIYHVRS